MAGLSVLDESNRNLYGVYPLCGKIINPECKKFTKVLENKIIKNMLRILGLKPEKEDKKEDKNENETDSSMTESSSSTQSSAFSTLRYGHIMIMADQDNDGSHIKGLLINLIHHMWPSLLRDYPNFLYQFITPIIRATPKV
jgi:DNA topoisomerase II